MTDRMARERKTIAIMIEMFCQDQHNSKSGSLCDDCRELQDYADVRLDRCPFGREKPVCSQCPIHCYNPAMREKIREVMRYAGPRMLKKHPLLGIRHLIDGRKKAGRKGQSAHKDGPVNGDETGLSDRDTPI